MSATATAMTTTATPIGPMTRSGKPISRALVLSLGLILCGATIAANRGVRWGFASVFMQFGVLALMADPNLFVMGEVWAGVLIGLSLDCDRRGREGLSCALGLSALFVRELAAIYCVVSTVTAIAHRRWRLVSQWCLVRPSMRCITVFMCSACESTIHQPTSRTQPRRIEVGDWRQS
jgi:hypothetical protein